MNGGDTATLATDCASLTACRYVAVSPSAYLAVNLP